MAKPSKNFGPGRRCESCRCFLRTTHAGPLCHPCAGTLWRHEHAAELEESARRQEAKARARSSRRMVHAEILAVIDEPPHPSHTAPLGGRHG